MKKKSELYKPEQEKLASKVMDILALDETNSFVLDDLDNDKEKISKLIKLVPEIRKYFKFGYMNAVVDPEKTVRPHICIIRSVLRDFYNIKYSRIQKNLVRSYKYVVTKK